MSEGEKEDVNIQEYLTNGRNPRNIPSAVFIEDVESFLRDAVGGAAGESVVGGFHELHGYGLLKYCYCCCCCCV